MTKRQYKQVIEILKKDCGIRKRYYKTGGLTCAIGALALAAGVTRTRLKKAGGRRIDYDDCADIADKIELKFGLSAFQLQKIQDANDNEEKRQDRVDSVINEVNIIADH